MKYTQRETTKKKSATNLKIHNSLQKNLSIKENSINLKRKGILITYKMEINYIKEGEKNGK